MRRLGGAWIGLALACGPAVPVDTSASGDPADPSGDGGLPPLTSGPATPPALTSVSEPAGDTESLPKYDIGGGVVTGPPDEDPCWTGWEVEPLPPAVVMVVDVSGSMVTHTLDHDGDPGTGATTRWFALRTALSRALLDWDPTHDLGLRTFPSALATTPPDPFACDSDGDALVPSLMGAPQVLDTLPPPDDLGLDGAAPLRAAIHEAWALLSVVDPGKQRFVVIITDGAPNCAPDDMPPASFDQLDAQVQDVVYLGALNGIRTALIAFDAPEDLPPAGMGEPQVDASAALDAIAFVGGISPSALVAADVASLQARLAEARALMPSDRLRIPDPSFFDYELVVGGTPYGPMFECSGGDGFVLLDSAGAYDTMQLCGQAALDLQRVGSATIVPFCGIAE